MNDVETFKKGVVPNGSRKEYHRSHGIATEMCWGTGDPMLSMLEWLCAQFMEAEVSGLTGAEKNVHSASRSDYRCGYRPRRLDTRMGTMYLMVPKRRGQGYIPYKHCYKKQLDSFSESTNCELLLTLSFPIEYNKVRNLRRV